MKPLVLLAVAFALSLSPATAQSISGVAEVVDGDTISIRGRSERIRLYGVDTSEGQQICEDAAGKRYLCGSSIFGSSSGSLSHSSPWPSGAPPSVSTGSDTVGIGS
jgi:hypothetical protein